MGGISADRYIADRVFSNRQFGIGELNLIRNAQNSIPKVLG